ncbi:Mitotic spindle assembly checkpoint protein MAD1 [Acipenser ruthenus]|uniref:Mitotic spindle assembly checkpoint protein MAD1 n=1 Tax=Acipenser ruthenus TaxID=7906 RepID=A0A444UMJ5_ACIRT|nr:Mitotic spindle assembly checkpoint protein MAD1 [Acipenser ruthenus]
MDNLEDNTTVFSTLKSFNNFLSQRMDTQQSLSEPSTAKRALQMQFQQRMQLEEQAEKIHSKSQLLQVDQEKKQMEFSHKRARIEFERAANTSAMDFERQVDRNQELLSRIKKLEEREAEMEGKLKEQTEINRSLRKSMEGTSKKLLEKESKLAEANETITALRAEILDLQRKFKSQEIKLTTQGSERQEYVEQMELLRKKCQEASQKTQMLQASQALNSENELKIKELEMKLALQEQDSMIVKNMKTDLSRLPDMERELKQLREENTYFRETRENNTLLKEETEGMRRKLERYENTIKDMVNLELGKEKLVMKLQAWENLEHATGLNIRTPEDLSREIIQIQQREITLKQQNYTVTSRARALEKARHQLQSEVLPLRTRLLEEQKKREQQDALVRRLQKRVLLLTKERDGMRAILESYDSELTASEYSPQLSRRVREAEEMVQKVQAHNSEMEVQLCKAQEEAGTFKLQAQTMEAEFNIVKSQAATADVSACVTGEEINSLRQKIEELEAERSRLEEQNNILEMRLEKHNLQGDYDPTKTKVMHFKMNPASLAKQQQVEDVQQLREQCKQLQERVQVLQAGGAVPAEKGGVNLPSSQEVMALLFADLRKQMESAELKNQRLKEVFKDKIQEFRAVCYTLTGYQIDITTENQYQLSSMYAEHKDDRLLFKPCAAFGKKLQIQTFAEILEISEAVLCTYSGAAMCCPEQQDNVYNTLRLMLAD